MADLYIGVVDWNKDYKHVLQVTGNQFNKVLTHMNTHDLKPIHINEFSLIKINDGSGEIKINEYYNRIQFYNYVMFRNSSSGGYFYAFIDSMGFEAHKTLHIKFTIDIWQMYTGSLSFKNSFVERMHISKSADTVGRWLAPEPFTPEYEAQTQIGRTSLDFEPIWFLESLSQKDSITGDWNYGGSGAGIELTGTYITKCGNAAELKAAIESFMPDIDWTQFDLVGTLKALAEALTGVDHRRDIVSIFALPKFIADQLPPFPSRNLVYTNEISLPVNNTLASGYIPKNNKMLTSLAKQYVVYSRNGIQKPLKPELMLSNSVDLTLSMRMLHCGAINVVIRNYDTINMCSFDMGYSGNIGVGYNENAGLLKTVNTVTKITGGVQNIAQGAVGIAGAVMSGGTSEIATLGAGMGSLGSIYGGLGQTASGALNYFVDNTAQLGGCSGDMLTLSNGMQDLRLLNCSPIYDKCKEMDEYLTTYGYSIQEFVTPSINNRSNWNYLQGDINFTCNADGNTKQALKNIFKTGVTVWHNPSNMMNYALPNN